MIPSSSHLKRSLHLSKSKQLCHALVLPFSHTNLVPESSSHHLLTSTFSTQLLPFGGFPNFVRGWVKKVIEEYDEEGDEEE